MKYWILIICVAITGCGFTPTYSTQTLDSSLSNIHINIIPNREGQIVRNHLIDRLHHGGSPVHADYNLKISPIRENIVEIGIDTDDEASRAQLRQEATVILTDINGKVVLNRTVRATSGYNILQGQFTTFVTEEDARKQALKVLSDHIITQLEIYFNT
jgi:LPS-assembly lipoprotein